MKSAKQPTSDAPAHRRSQPVRQTRTHPPRSFDNPSCSAAARDSTNNAGPSGNQPIDVFPAITHFADAITALPKELVRHFTLLKEVDAKLFAPEDQLCKLVDATVKFPPPSPYRAIIHRAATPPGRRPRTRLMARRAQPRARSLSPCHRRMRQPPPSGLILPICPVDSCSDT